MVRPPLVGAHSRDEMRLPRAGSRAEGMMPGDPLAALPRATERGAAGPDARAEVRFGSLDSLRGIAALIEKPLP